MGLKGVHVWSGKLWEVKEENMEKRTKMLYSLLAVGEKNVRLEAGGFIPK